MREAICSPVAAAQVPIRGNALHLSNELITLNELKALWLCSCVCRGGGVQWDYECGVRWSGEEVAWSDEGDLGDKKQGGNAGVHRSEKRVK